MPLRDFPWRWTNLAIGLIPLAILSRAAHHLGSLEFVYLSSGLWIPISLLAQAWMIGYPLWVAGGFNPLPGSRMAFEGLVALLCLPGVLIATAIMAAFVPADARDAAPHAFDTIAHSHQPHQVLALVFLAVVAAPLGEELCFRGMLFNAIRRRADFIPAALLQAIVFALYHPYGAQGRIGVATMGFALALLYEWRGTLVAPIALHSLINVYLTAAAFQ